MHATSISVAMCTYNGERYLQEQLDSLLTQTRPPDELVVCDDGSTDRTLQILEDFANSPPFKVRVLRNEERLGPSQNFARCIQRCTGDLIALADQDDVWMPRKLEVQAREHLADDRCALVFHDGYVTDRELEPLGYRMWEFAGVTEEDLFEMVQGDPVRVLAHGGSVTGMTMMVKRSYRAATLPVPDRWMHDAWLALVLAAIGEVRAIKEPLVQYRQHGSNDMGMARTGGRLRPFQAALRSKKGYYADRARFYRQAYDRLRELEDAGYELRGDAGFLAEASRHMEVRSNMPEDFWQRVPEVRNELRRGRYDRISQGWKSAAKDLLVGT